MNKSLQYFVGKACTVFTVPINRDYRTENPNTYPQQLLMYFTGVVESVDDIGLTLVQLDSGHQKSFFFLDRVVGIAEETVLNPEKEEDKKVIDKLQTLTSPMKSGPLIDPLGMSKLIKQIKPEA